MKTASKLEGWLAISQSLVAQHLLKELTRTGHIYTHENKDERQ